MFPKSYLPNFLFFERLPLYLSEIPFVFPFFPFLEGISLHKVATTQNNKNRESNFLGTLIRMIHAKFQTSMTMLQRIDAFLRDSTEKGIFPFIKGIQGILRGK